MSEAAKKAAHNVAEIARTVIRENMLAELERQLSKNLERMKRGGQTRFVVTITGIHKHEKVTTTVCSVSDEASADKSALG